MSSRPGENATPKEKKALRAELYQQIGQLKVELDWLKKKAGLLNCSEATTGRA
jgi:hypothetical protein